MSPGETVGLVGPNGSGKSTLVSILIGRLKPDDGTVTLYTNTSSRRSFSVQYQGASLPSRMTIAEAVVFWARSWRNDESDYFGALRQVGLNENHWHRPSAKLSGGERRKALVALTIASPTPVVVLDEPTVGLDLDAKAALTELMNAKRDEGRSILVSTHELDFAETVGDRFEFLISGRIRRSMAAGEVSQGKRRKMATLWFKTAEGRQRARRKLAGVFDPSTVSDETQGGQPMLMVDIDDEMDFFQAMSTLPCLRFDLSAVELRAESLAEIYQEANSQAAP